MWKPKCFVRPTILLMLLTVTFISACMQFQNNEKTTNSLEVIDEPNNLAEPCGSDDECIQSTNIPITPTITPPTLTMCPENRTVSTRESVQGLTGGLIYDARGITYLIGGHPVEIDEIDKTVLNGLIGFSPNGQWLLSFAETPQTLRLISNDNDYFDTTIMGFPMGVDSATAKLSTMLWISNETLLVYISQPLKDAPGMPHYIIALLNPFTGDWQQSIIGSLNRRLDDVLLTSPDMSRVLYVDRTNDGFPIIRLDDLSNQKELWGNPEDAHANVWSRFVESDQGWFGAASWAPDSSKVAFHVLSDEGDSSITTDNISGVYLLDRNGVDGRLITDFTGRNDNESIQIAYLSWSPDSRYLAMSVSFTIIDPATYHVLEVENRLYIYDSKNDELIDLCWLSDGISGAKSTTGTFVWSPDSRYITYPADSSIINPGAQPLVIIDTHTGEVIELVDNVSRLRGWSEHFSP